MCAKYNKNRAIIDTNTLLNFYYRYLSFTGKMKRPGYVRKDSMKFSIGALVVVWVVAIVVCAPLFVPSHWKYKEDMQLCTMPEVNKSLNQHGICVIDK